jgi:hypothetical protein
MRRSGWMEIWRSAPEHTLGPLPQRRRSEAKDQPEERAVHDEVRLGVALPPVEAERPVAERQARRLAEAPVEIGEHLPGQLRRGADVEPADVPATTMPTRSVRPAPTPNAISGSIHQLLAVSSMSVPPNVVPPNSRPGRRTVGMATVRGGMRCPPTRTLPPEIDEVTSNSGTRMGGLSMSISVRRYQCADRV